MSQAMNDDVELPVATDGMIAAINFESMRRRSWRRFDEDPQRPGLAALIVEQEMIASQFFSDFKALDRLEALARDLANDHSSATQVLLAQIASATHRFEDARQHLARAQSRGALDDDGHRVSLTIDQACGTSLDALLDERRRLAGATGNLQDFVSLGALLADLERFDESDAVYRKALAAYGDVSPFPLALVCFQLGTLWGELASDTDNDRAATWYRRAVGYLPGYVKARVHLAEIYTENVEALLLPLLDSGDPEVQWRIADARLAQGLAEQARPHLESARLRYEELLCKHLLAFADHAAEFYAGSGSDAARAMELARANLANRPTRRAKAQMDGIALAAGVTR